MRAAAGLEVLTGLALIVAPSILACFLFGSDLNAAGEATGRISGFVLLSLAARPAYHPAVLLKLYIYGYLNRVQSSRRLEREAGRNVEVMWLTGRHRGLPEGQWPRHPPCRIHAHAIGNLHVNEKLGHTVRKTSLAVNWITDICVRLDDRWRVKGS